MFAETYSKNNIAKTDVKECTAYVLRILSFQVLSIHQPLIYFEFVFVYRVRISLVAQMVVSAFNAGDPGSIPGLGRSSGEGNGNPLQDSHLENPMDGGAW